jgi:hypothetical protein
MGSAELIKRVSYTVLGHRVLAVCVAMYGESGKLIDWTVYVDAVPGRDHEKEHLQVAISGDKPGFIIAKTLFPEMDKKKYRC